LLEGQASRSSCSEQRQREERSRSEEHGGGDGVDVGESCNRVSWTDAQAIQGVSDIAASGKPPAWSVCGRRPRRHCENLQLLH